MAEGRNNLSQRGPYRGRDDRQPRRDEPHVPDIDLSRVRFGDNLEAQLFNEVAQHCAKTISESNQRCNKPSQLRRFYDELLMWVAKVDQAPERFAEYRPFILMLNAKAAYAKGRELVDPNFVALLAHCLSQAEDARTLGQVKLFLEAFLGFYKAERPREN